MASLAPLNSKQAYQERLLIFLSKWLLVLTIGLATVNSLWLLWDPPWRTLVQNVALLAGGGVGWLCLRLTRRGHLSRAARILVGSGILLSALLTMVLGQQHLLYGLVSLSFLVLMATFLEPACSIRWALAGAVSYLGAITIRFWFSSAAFSLAMPDLVSLYLFPAPILIAFAALGRSMGHLLEQALSTLEQQAAEHRQTSETAALRERFLQTVLDAIQDGISILDADLNVVHVNRTMEQWYKDWLPLAGKCYAAYHNRQSPCEPCPSLRALETGTLQTDVIRLTNPSGQESWLELYAFPMLDVKGETSGIVEYVHNITERKQAQEALAQEQALLRTLIDHLPDSVYVKDRQGRFLLNNAESMRRIGVSDQSELLGKTDLDFFPADMARQWMAQEQEIMRTAEALLDQEYLVENELGRRWLRTTKVPIHNPQDEVIGLVGISHDITESKNAQAERETLIVQLQDALAQVKTLRGLLPICAHCKKIRTEQGNWQHIEVYVRAHSQAEFSHGLCPECASKLYPDYFPDEP